MQEAWLRAKSLASQNNPIFAGETETPSLRLDLEWREWLQTFFPAYVRAGYAPHQESLWRWIDALRPQHRPRARIEIWPRGGAKSTTAELGVTHAGVRNRRSFVLYVSKSQLMANAHISAISALLERLGVARAVNRYSQSKGWTQQLLRTATGFNVLALGLDVGVRGRKLDQFRPDFIILDDVDDRHDSDLTIDKKIEQITQSILPSGSDDLAVLFIQNKIHKNSIAARLIDGRADFLLDRDIPSEIPAVEGLNYERRQLDDGLLRYVITGGKATWQGQSLEICERQMNDWGRIAFLREAQHSVKQTEHGLWSLARDIEPYRETRLPKELIRIAVGVDPSNTATGDEAGVIVMGLAWCNCRNTGKPERHLFLISDVSIQGSPNAWATAAVTAFNIHNADVMVAEDNNGGEMVETTIKGVEHAPPVKRIHASRGKLTRAEPIHLLAEQGKIHHVGLFPWLEDELTSWEPGHPSPNRLDAYVWAATELAVLFHERRAARSHRG